MSKAPVPATPARKPLHPVPDRMVSDVVETAMHRYGTLTIENRSIPDFHDGMKSVYRRLLWCAYNDIGMRPDKGFKKSALLIGDTMGKYHPHGDTSLYGALVTMVNQPSSFFDKQGNFGHILGAPPAAMRYTECRISTNGIRLLLDPRYLAVTEMVANYDGSAVEPVVLPARIPTVLMTGAQGIAVGITTMFPSFTLASVEKMTKALFARFAKKGKITEIDTKDLMHLEFECAGGGYVISPEEEIIEFFENGLGKIMWSCDYELDAKARTVTINGIPPGWNVSRIEKLSEIEDVVRVRDLSARGAIKIVVEFKPSLSAMSFEAVATKKLQPLLQIAQHYRLNFIDRRAVVEDDGLKSIKTELDTMPVGALIERWCKWRVDLEVRAARYEQSQLHVQIDHEVALLAAVDHLDVLFEILKSRTIKDKPGEIAVRLKLKRRELGEWLWSLPVGRFDRLNHDTISAKLKTLTTKLRAAEEDENNPIPAVLRNLNA